MGEKTQEKAFVPKQGKPEQHGPRETASVSDSPKSYSFFDGDTDF